MIHIDFDPSKLKGEDLTWWNSWVTKASAATESAKEDHESGKGITFNPKIWSELKKWLLDNVFHGKCAYCESQVTVTEWGDADHFRPKGAVTVLESKKYIKVEKDNILHPGYYWVAYNWKNLLPSCKRCNSERKLYCFPVANQHIFSPNDASQYERLNELEKPLLLHPYFDNPRKHLKFGKHGGVHVKNGSDMGKASIILYGLRREPLKKNRKKEQENAFKNYLVHLVSNRKKAEKYLQKIRNGEEVYSAAICDYLDFKLLKIDKDRQRLEC